MEFKGAIDARDLRKDRQTEAERRVKKQVEEVFADIRKKLEWSKTATSIEYISELSPEAIAILQEQFHYKITGGLHMDTMRNEDYFTYTISW